MKIDVTKADGYFLDYLVAIGQGIPADSPDFNLRYMSAYRFSLNNELSGEVIDREHISTLYLGDHEGGWWATAGDPREEETMGCNGDTRSQAAMRAYAVKVHGETYEMDSNIYDKLKYPGSIPEDDHRKPPP